MSTEWRQRNIEESMEREPKQMTQAEVIAAAGRATDAVFEALERSCFKPGYIKPDTGKELTQDEYDELRAGVTVAAISAFERAENIEILEKEAA